VFTACTVLFIPPIVTIVPVIVVVTIVTIGTIPTISPVARHGIIGVEPVDYGR
jgi:hypothetical protein